MEKNSKAKVKAKAQTASTKSFYDPKVTLVTKEGLQKMFDELDNLRNCQLVEIAGKLKEAVAQGDLSENAEYADAKEQQQMVLLRITELEELIKRAEVIKKKSAKGDAERVTIGCSVTVCNMSRDKKNETYLIVGSLESNPFENKISNTSPLGRELIGKKKGDELSINVPAGEMTYRVVKVA
ncbi:MAG: transcription elongation factor GreA [Patescibacteria group bacterium]|nr:transcription elongation factor GreA [Patescibacteria group bacterium]